MLCCRMDEVPSFHCSVSVCSVCCADIVYVGNTHPQHKATGALFMHGCVSSQVPCDCRQAPQSYFDTCRPTSTNEKP